VSSPDTPAPAAAAPDPSSSLRRHLQVAGVLLAALVALGALLGVVTFRALLDVRTELIDHIDLARTENQRLLAAVVDQETGLRGYVQTDDPELLRSYTASAEVQDDALAELRAVIGHRADLEEPLGSLEASVDRWEASGAEALLALAQGDGAEDEEVLAGTQVLLDDVQASSDALDAELDRLRAEAREQLDRRTLLLISVLLGALLLIAVYGVVVWVAARRLVLGPVDRLRRDAVAVAWGELEHRVEPTGPRELVDVGDAVEAMRRRILGDLALVERALAELEERADDLARSNRDLEQFAYVASHDLQEPLRKVASFCQLLQQRYAGQLDERADQYIAFAVDGAKRMQGLINDLLAFSRVGRTTERFEPVDLDAVLDAVRNDLATSIEDTGATIEQLTPLPTVPGDRSLLGTLLVNLVGNSVKFRGEDPPVVRVSAEPQPAAGSSAVPMWCFTVSDNGIGIEPEYADRVFVIFQRLHSRESYDGTGIGLALCKKIVEFHGGTIWIDHTGSDGTTIRWTLPAEEREAVEFPA
jgi:signal transduction histidine kinase